MIDVRAGRTVVVEDLNIRAENDGDVHQLRVELHLPDELGGTLEAGIDLVEQAGSLASQTATFTCVPINCRSRHSPNCSASPECLNVSVTLSRTSIPASRWSCGDDGKTVVWSVRMGPCARVPSPIPLLVKRC